LCELGRSGFNPWMDSMGGQVIHRPPTFHGRSMLPLHSPGKTSRPVRSAYQPSASSTFLSERTSHQQPASSTLLSEQTSTSHQRPSQPNRLSDAAPAVAFTSATHTHGKIRIPADPTTGPKSFGDVCMRKILTGESPIKRTSRRP
jgi:hypothetical protein